MMRRRPWRGVPGRAMSGMLTAPRSTRSGSDAQDELDLHEMRLEDALEATGSFLDRSHSRGLRKVRIITGKGIHSKKGEAVLRPAVIDLCRSHSKVREVTVPKASEGGSGALSVILKAR